MYSRDVESSSQRTDWQMLTREVSNPQKLSLKYGFNAGYKLFKNCLGLLKQENEHIRVK